jgi:hypothetical protein
MQIQYDPFLSTNCHRNEISRKSAKHTVKFFFSEIERQTDLECCLSSQIFQFFPRDFFTEKIRGFFVQNIANFMFFCLILSTLCRQVIFHIVPHFGKRADKKYSVKSPQRYKK